MQPSDGYFYSRQHGTIFFRYRPRRLLLQPSIVTTHETAAINDDALTKISDTAVVVDEIRVLDGNVLSVGPAPEPDDIIWESLEFGFWRCVSLGSRWLFPIRA